jgi:hypothetical protein
LKFTGRATTTAATTAARAAATTAAAPRRVRGGLRGRRVGLPDGAQRVESAHRWSAGAATSAARRPAGESFCRHRFLPTGDLGYRGVRGAVGLGYRFTVYAALIVNCRFEIEAKFLTGFIKPNKFVELNPVAAKSDMRASSRRYRCARCCGACLVIRDC